MQLSDYLTVERVLGDMTSTTKQAALEELAGLVTRDTRWNRRDVSRVLSERERLASTGIGDEIAIPHGKLDTMDELVLSLARSKAGLDFESEDGRPTRLFFVLVAPESSTGIHLKALARISRLCKEPRFRQQLLEAEDEGEMFDILCRMDRKFVTPA